MIYIYTSTAARGCKWTVAAGLPELKQNRIDELRLETQSPPSIASAMRGVMDLILVGDRHHIPPTIRLYIRSVDYRLWNPKLISLSDCRENLLYLAVVLALREAAKVSQFTTVVAASHGSLGYMAPEYSFSARVNEKIDVYSFGVVLLELVTGKRAIDPTIYGEGGPNLLQWVNEKVQTPEGVYETLEPSCERSSQEDMISLLRIGMLCTGFVPARRPSLRDVVTLLSDIAPKSCVNSDVDKYGSEKDSHDSLQ